MNPSPELKDTKKRLRQEMIAKRKAMSSEKRLAADAAILERVLEHPAYRAADRVFAYVSMPHEVGTGDLLREILRAGKELGLPVCDTVLHTMQFYRLESIEELRRGAYRIPVPPVQENRLLMPHRRTLLLLPMLACDREGNRLGAGGGYYDRYLQNHDVQTLGLCYADFVLEHLPHEAYDQRFSCCITEQNTEEFYVKPREEQFKS